MALFRKEMTVPSNDALFNKFKLRRGNRILEIACGASLYFSITSALIGKGCKYMGIDIDDEDMLLLTFQKHVAERYVEKLTGEKETPLFIRMDAFEMGFKKDSFDAIICNNFVTLLSRSKHQELIDNISEIVKVGGVILLAPLGADVLNYPDFKNITVEYIIGLAKKNGISLKLIEENINVGRDLYSAALFKVLQKS